MGVIVFTDFCEAGDGDFDVVGVVDVFEFEAFVFAGGLNEDVSKGEECGKESFCFTGHVLNLIEIHF